MIGDDIRIMVVKIVGDKVRFGIEAPKDMTVHRTEVYKLIKGLTQDKDQQAAA